MKAQELKGDEDEKSLNLIAFYGNKFGGLVEMGQTQLVLPPLFVVDHLND